MQLVDGFAWWPVAVTTWILRSQGEAGSGQNSRGREGETREPRRIKFMKRCDLLPMIWTHTKTYSCAGVPHTSPQRTARAHVTEAFWYIFWCSLGTSPELRFDHLAGDLCLGIFMARPCNKAWDMPSLTAKGMGSKASPYEHQDHSRRRMNSVPWKFCTILDQDFVVCFRCLQSEFVCPCRLEAFTTHHTATCCHGPSRSQLKSTCVKRV